MTSVVSIANKELWEDRESLEDYILSPEELPPTDLIYDDGEPMETNHHRIAMNILIDSVENFLMKQQDDFYVGGNMFIYYSATQARNRDFRGPDFFLVLDTNSDVLRKAWVVWNENGRYPDVVIELMSPSTAHADKHEKKDIYEKIFKTREYYVFDPFDRTSLQGWRLNNKMKYEEITPNEKGWLFCESVNLWLGTWEGVIRRENNHWLRFFDRNSNLVLLPSEEEQQKAQLAQEEAQLAQQEAQQAQQKAQLAQEEAQHAQQEAQLAKEKYERLAARLRELGENPQDYS
ncbi:Uma2 family endonuclease [Geminocystis sp. CENA526]|uniref:Uma2 family endonuclease n=1 Tax=Geminocystis sp. CENA526 TaxID=1355871 RepID=UPI003D6FB5CD